MSLPFGSSFAMNEAYFAGWPKTEEAKTLAVGVGTRLARLADGYAPRGIQRKPGTFALHTGMRCEPVLLENGWVGRVKALNYKARWYEFGNSHVEPQPFLRPAAITLGLHLQESE